MFAYACSYVINAHIYFPLSNSPVTAVELKTGKYIFLEGIMQILAFDGLLKARFPHFCNAAYPNCVAVFIRSLFLLFCVRASQVEHLTDLGSCGSGRSIRCYMHITVAAPCTISHTKKDDPSLAPSSWLECAE